MLTGLSHWFKKKSTLKNYLQVDIHSHLIPGIDDGVKTLSESILILKSLSTQGIEKVITTPHVMEGYYENSTEDILAGLKQLKKEAKKEGLEIEIEAAAEYFLDENLFKKLSQESDFLTIKDQYFLFETAFLNKPIFLEEAIYAIKSRGLIPLLAHPERYNYLLSEPKLVLQLKNLGCEFQVNVRSLSKNNSKGSRDFIYDLLSKNMVSFFGSDIHNERHLSEVVQLINKPLFDEIMLKQVKNNILK